MAVKPVLDIDVNSTKFQRYVELYNKYRASVDKLPGAWNQMAKTQEQMGKKFADLTAAYEAFVETESSSDDSDEKRLKRLERSSTLWTLIAKSAKSTAKGVLDIGSGILRWGSFIGGIATGASLWGLNRIGQSVSDSRRSSSGLGLSIGQQKAFGNAFSRFVDPGSFLGGVSASVSDLSKQSALYSIGVNPNGSTSDVAIATLKRVWQMAHSTPVNQLGVLESSRRLSDLGISVDDLRRLRSTSKSELDRQLGTYRAGVGQLNINDKTGQVWQDFTQQMEKAGTQIENVFVKALPPLLPSINKLSDSLVKLFERVATNGDVSKGIDKFADWIGSLSGTISKPEFLNSVDQFISGVGGLADAVRFWAHPITNTRNALSDYGKRAEDEETIQDFRNSVINAQSNSFGLPANMLAAQWMLESGRSMNGNLVNKQSGALGIFQFMPATARALGIDATDPMQSAYGAAKLDRQNLDHFRGDVAKALASYDIKGGQGAIDSLVKRYGNAWSQHLPRETANYLSNAQRQGVNIMITNATGGSAVVALSQLAP